MPLATLIEPALALGMVAAFGLAPGVIAGLGRL